MIIHVFFFVVLVDFYSRCYRNSEMSQQNFIGLLVGKLDPRFSSIVHENAGQVLIEINSTSSWRVYHQLIDQIESKETVEQLFNFVIYSNSKSNHLLGMCVINRIVEKKTIDGENLRP